MPVESSAERSRRVPPGRLWFGAAGAAVAWALQGFTCFLISTQACADGTGDWGPLPALGVRILLGGVSAAYLAVAAASGWVSYRNWKMLAEDQRLMRAEGHGRKEYMALVGMFVALICVVGLIWSGIPPIYFEVCNTFR